MFTSLLQKQQNNAAKNPWKEARNAVVMDQNVKQTTSDLKEDNKLLTEEPTFKSIDINIQMSYSKSLQGLHLFSIIVYVPIETKFEYIQPV